MFKWFTWQKVGGWALIAGALLSSPLIGGVVGAALAAKIAAIGAALVGIGTAVTTTKAGAATNAAGDQINGAQPGK